MPQTQQSPVYVMMKKEDQYDIVLIAVMDLMLKNLMDRSHALNLPKRAYWYRRLHQLLSQIEGSYQGALPEEMVNKADRFNRMISADLTSMLKLAKE